MLKVNAGATGANAPTGIKAAHSAFMKRPNADDPAVSEAGSVKWQPSTGAGVTAAKRPTPAQAAIAAAAQSTAAAQPVDTVEISDKGYEALGKPSRKNGMYVALDQLEKYEYGRKILDKLKASDAGIEIDYVDGRACVYVDGLSEEDRNVAVYGHIGAIYGETAQPVAIVEISDEGRELAAQMGEANTAAAPTINVINDKGYEHITSQIRIYSDTDDLPLNFKLPDNFLAARAQGKAPINSFDPKDFLYGDDTLTHAIAATLNFKYDVDNVTSFKLSAELGRLLLDPNGTLEERVVNREKGLELAKYFAENYIDDPAAKQNFLDRAKEVANTAEMRDKGYDFRYNREDGTITVEKTDDDMLASWGKLTEKQATDIINKTKNSLDMNAIKEDVVNTFKKIMANYMNADGTALAVPKW